MIKAQIFAWQWYESFLHTDHNRVGYWLIVVLNYVADEVIKLVRWSCFWDYWKLEVQEPVSQKTPLVILCINTTMVAKVISELKALSRLEIFPETGPEFWHC